MTEQKVIQYLTAIRDFYLHEEEEEITAINDAIAALEEIQQYRAIGTVDECREAVKKQREIEEIVNMQLIAGSDTYEETYSCFYEIVKVVQRVDWGEEKRVENPRITLSRFCQNTSKRS